MKMQVPAFFALLLTIALSGPSFGAENGDIRTSLNEYALLSGYGITNEGVGRARVTVQTFDVIGRYGRFLTDELGEGWYKGRPELLLELPLHLAFDPKVSPMVGGYLLGCWKFTAPSPFVPYLFVGTGVLYVDLDLKSMGSRANFVFQGGGGFQYFFRKNMALDLEYRYHHISNAGLSNRNAPVNSSKALLGISIFR
jgi:hypothetical protein